MGRAARECRPLHSSANHRAVRSIHRSASSTATRRPRFVHTTRTPILPRTARFDARVVVLAQRELPAREHPAQRDACRGQPTFQPTLHPTHQPTFRQPLVDELLPHLGVLIQQDLEDVLPPGLDLGILDRAEPLKQLLARRPLGLLRERSLGEQFQVLHDTADSRPYSLSPVVALTKSCCSWGIASHRDRASRLAQSVELLGMTMLITIARPLPARRPGADLCEQDGEGHAHGQAQ